jgi:hypothetical protein
MTYAPDFAGAGVGGPCHAPGVRWKRLGLSVLVGLCLISGARADSKVDGVSLPTLLSQSGFTPPEGFKALVIVLPKRGTTGPARAYDWHGTSADRDDWWPASTVKLFAAVAALETTHRLGFGPRTQVTYEYPEGPVTLRLDRIVKDALIPSNNLAYDRLIEITGFDALHRQFFTKQHGFRNTVLLRAYGGRIKDPVTQRGINLNSPPITLSFGKKQKQLSERNGKPRGECPEQGNCTSLAELAETLRRVMLHDELPEAERFDLGKAELELLHSALGSTRPRGENIVDGLRAGFGPQRPVTLHHKAGFALKWMSDAVLVEETATGQRYIVALAGYPGRESLDQAALSIGKLLAQGAFATDPPAMPMPAPIGAPITAQTL